jgi:transposase
MPRRQPPDPKREQLRQQGALNPRPERVSDELFRDTDFFDARDLVQVKYEMLRRVDVEQHPVSQSARAFGFSRPTFYQARGAFKRGGLAGLVPQRRGPRTAHKLSAEVLDFVAELQTANPSLAALDLAAAIAERFGVTVHPRSVERALERKKKDQRR